MLHIKNLTSFLEKRTEQKSLAFLLDDASSGNQSMKSPSVDLVEPDSCWLR